MSFNILFFTIRAISYCFMSELYGDLFIILVILLCYATYFILIGTILVIMLIFAFFYLLANLLLFIVFYCNIWILYLDQTH